MSKRRAEITDRLDQLEEALERAQEAQCALVDIPPTLLDWPGQCARRRAIDQTGELEACIRNMQRCVANGEVA